MTKAEVAAVEASLAKALAIGLEELDKGGASLEQWKRLSAFSKTILSQRRQGSRLQC